MRCEEVVERLPDESPDVAEHLRGCAPCRAEDEAYARDGQLLALGLRAAAGEPALGAPVAARLLETPSARRRIVPLAAAAAMLVGVLAIIFASRRGDDPTKGHPAPATPADTQLQKPSLLVIHGEAEDDLQIIPTDRVLWAQVVGIDENRLVQVSAGASDALEIDQKLTVYRRIQGGYSEVGTLRLLRIAESTASGRLVEAKLAPRAGDVVVAGRPLGADDRKAVLEYILSFRLRGANASSPYDRLVRGAGLEHDVEFLARLKDPRAHDRLARILANVAPFAKEGFPAAGSDLAGRMHEWWATSKDRVRWNAEADRFEEIGK